MEYSNGKLKSEIEYNKSEVKVKPLFGCIERSGIKKEYNENGELEYEIPFVNGLKHGIVKLYYSNGKLREELPYFNGKIVGLSKYYNEDGELISETNWVNGETT